MHIQIGSKSSWSAFWHCPATQPQTRSVIRASDDGSFVAKGCGPEFHCRMPSSQTLCIWQKNWALRPACSKQVERLAMALAIGGLTGYPRENGRKGVRNLVAVLAAADNVNPLARHLAARNPGVVCLPASYGRGQMGRDFEVSLRAMAGLAAHPNIAGCLVVSFEPESSARVAQLARALGRPVETLSSLEAGGMDECLDRGSSMLRRMQDAASRMKRVALTVRELTVGLECGGSDTTSGLFGNPALGVFTDWVVDGGGTAVF